jgi:cyclin-dependent kinase 12/13
MREIEICQLLRQQPQQNIVNMYEIVIMPELAFVVMDCIELTLHERIDVAGGSLCQQEMEQYFSDLLSGLEFLHSKGIIHRDIKPNNLLLQQLPSESDASSSFLLHRLMIIDFGLSTLVEKPRAMTNVSKLTYAAPELLLGERCCFPIDVWAAGCCIAEGLCGRSLFQGSTEIQRLHSIFRVCGEPLRQLSDLFSVDDDEAQSETTIEEELRSLAEVTDDFAHALQRILTCDQERRITASQALRLLPRRA